MGGRDWTKEKECGGFYYLIGDSHPGIPVCSKTTLPNWGLQSHRYPERKYCKFRYVLLFTLQIGYLGSSAILHTPHWASSCCNATPYLLNDWLLQALPACPAYGVSAVRVHFF